MKQLDLFENEDIFKYEDKHTRLQENYFEDFQQIVLKSNVKKDEYTDYIEKAFDLKVTDTSIVKIPNKITIDSLGVWNICVICGASGSGKSTILNNIAKEVGSKVSQPSFDNNKCLISNFDNMSPKDATILLASMGLASVPTWIRPFNVLSNGEQYRAKLAKCVCEAKKDDIIFVDEYTSVVDRNVAKAMSNALQKYIRKNNKRLILATCHYDILDWIRPDWIYDLNKGGVLERGDYFQRPPIELQVYRTTTDTWERFKKYHYMTHELNDAATCFVFTWDNKLAAFVGVLPFPNGLFKNAFRGTRTVVLPDFQGLGIGSHITDFVAGVYKASGKAYFTKTVNPALGEYRDHSPNWKPTSGNGKGQTEAEVSKEHNMMGGMTRVSYCHRYIGKPIYGFEDLLLPIEKIRDNKRNEGQLMIFQENYD